MALYGGSLYGGSINLFWRLIALYERNFKNFLIYLNKQTKKTTVHLFLPLLPSHLLQPLVFVFNFLDFTCKKTIWYLSSSDRLINFF